jgi:mannose-1-phosphate guanylyltransferase
MEGPVQALVLVGGFGTRLRPITYTLPKQLIPIAGKPMLYHLLDLLPKEVDHVVFASGYKADVLDAYLRAHPPAVAWSCVAEATPLGTGGGMKNAGGSMSDPFLVLNSDVIAETRLTELLAFHRAHGGVGAMTLIEVDDPRPYGIAALSGEDRIEKFVEKPTPEAAPSRWANAGMSVWRRSVLDAIPDGRPVSWEQEIVPGLLPQGVFGYRSRGFWEDAGTPERLLHSQRLLFDAGRGGTGKLPPGAHGTGPVAFAPDVVATGATFGPYVHLGAGVRVGAAAHVENSVIMDGAIVEPAASVVGSVIGPRAIVRSDRTVRGQVLGEGADA